MHFPLHLTVPKFSLRNTWSRERDGQETLVHHWLGICQEQFDIDEYSRAVRDVKTDWSEDCKSPKKGGAPATTHVPNSIAMLAMSSPSPSTGSRCCVYGNNLHGSSGVNLHGWGPGGRVGPLFLTTSYPYQDSGDHGAFSQKLVKNLCRHGREVRTSLWRAVEEGKPSHQPLTRSLAREKLVRPVFEVLSGPSVHLPFCARRALGAAVKSAEIALPSASSASQIPAVSPFCFGGDGPVLSLCSSPLLIYFLS